MSSRAARPIPHSVHTPQAAAAAACQRVVDQPDLLRGRAGQLVGRVIGHEREVQLGLRPGLELGQRREVAGVAAAAAER